MEERLGCPDPCPYKLFCAGGMEVIEYRCKVCGNKTKTYGLKRNVRIDELSGLPSDYNFAVPMALVPLPKVEALDCPYKTMGQDVCRDCLKVVNGVGSS